MKTRHLPLTVLLFLMSLTVAAQNFDGSWYGILKVQGTQLRINFNIKQSADSISTTMDSPDQGAFGIPVTTVKATDSTLTIEMPQIKLTYNGHIMSDGSIDGTFKQGSLTAPMPLSRQIVVRQETNRPQNPQRPYPYKDEQVTFRNRKDTITLAGTLTLPDRTDKSAAVVLISGSGAQNRDEELAGHKPFLVLADHLTRNGIAVLRFDDRGSFDSKGDFAKATSFDFAEDVKSAVNYLKTRPEIDPSKIGLIGHSEGGLIAPLVAAEDKTVAFIVMMAGPGIPGDSIILMQAALIGEVAGMSQEAVTTARNFNRVVYKMVADGASKQDIAKYINSTAPMMKSDEIDSQLKTLLSPWFLAFLNYDPAPTLERVSCPVLALNGTKDLQVPCQINLDAIEAALQKGGNNRVTIKRFDNMNHLFQMCETGAPSEYSDIEETINPMVLDAISSWIYSLDILRK